MGGSGGSAAADGAAKGGTGGLPTMGGIDGLATGGSGETETGGAGGSVALDAGAMDGANSSDDGGIDVPFSYDTNLPVDQGTGGSTTDGAIVGGTGGSRTDGPTAGGTGGTATGGAGGTVKLDAGTKADAISSGDGKTDVPFSYDTNLPSDLTIGHLDVAEAGGLDVAGAVGFDVADAGGVDIAETGGPDVAEDGSIDVAGTGGAGGTGGTGTGGAGGTGGTGTGGATGPTIISIRFVGGRTGGAPGTTTMSATDSAGFKPAANWNSALNATGTLSSLVAADGSTATGASITWNSPGTYTVGFTDTSGDARMMNGFLEAKDLNSPITINLTLPSSMSGAYDVYVYCYGYIDASTRTYQYKIGSTTQTVSQTGHSVTTFPGHSLAPVSGTGSGTYILFQNVTGTTFTLTATALSSTASPAAYRVPVNAIQIVYPAGS
jgi:hypothetical protein